MRRLKPSNTARACEPETGTIAAVHDEPSRVDRVGRIDRVDTRRIDRVDTRRVGGVVTRIRRSSNPRVVV